MQAPPKAALFRPGSSQLALPLPDPVVQPREFLSAVFEMVVATDKEGYFLRPVDESVAPNYYQQIKSPLCFADMRGKLEASSYTSYRSLMADFELIINNAKTFNKEKTKCYKCAMTLSRNVSKIMGAHEIGIRKAFSVLQPQGLTTNTAGLGSSRGTPNLLDTSDITSTRSSGQVHNHQPAAEQGGVSAQHQPVKPEPAAAAHAAGLVNQHAIFPPPQPQPAVPASTAPITLHPLCRALSDDEEQDRRHVLQHHRQLQDKQAHGNDRQLVSLEALMAELRHAAVYQPWSDLVPAQPAANAPGTASQQQAGAPAAQEAAPEVGSAGPAADVQTAGSGQDRIAPVPAGSLQQQPAAVTTSISAALQAQQQLPDELRPVRDSLEWQCHWLQLRMQELEAQLDRLSQPAVSSLQAVSTEQQAADQVATQGGSGSSEVVAAQLLAHKQQLSSTVERHLQGCSTASLLPSTAPQSKLHVSVAIPPLHSAFFFSGQAGRPQTILQPATPHATACSDVEMTDASTAPCAAGPSTTLHAMDVDPGSSPAPAAGSCDPAAPGTSMPALPILGHIPNTQLPAAVFASLDILQSQLSDIKRGLQTAFVMDKGRGRSGVARSGALPQLSFAAANAMAGTPSSAAGLLRRPSSARPLPPMRSGSLIHTAPFKSGDTATKRKRTDTDTDTLSPYYSRTLDKPAAILIPPVRLLADEELRARQKAMSAWEKVYGRTGPGAWERPPRLVLEVCGDEGSSSEDTSDEAYAVMHNHMAEEERKRFMAAEGQRRRNKQSKTAAKNTIAAAKGTPTGGSGAKPPPSLKRTATIKAPRPGGVGPAVASPLAPHHSPSLADSHTALGGNHLAPPPPSTQQQSPSPPLPTSLSGPLPSASAKPLQRAPSGQGLQSVVLVTADAMPSVPAVTTATHPFHMQPADNLLSSLPPAVDMPRRVSPATSLTPKPSAAGAAQAPPKPPINPATRPSPPPLPIQGLAGAAPGSASTSRGGSPATAATPPNTHHTPQAPTAGAAGQQGPGSVTTFARRTLRSTTSVPATGQAHQPGSTTHGELQHHAGSKRSTAHAHPARRAQHTGSEDDAIQDSQGGEEVHSDDSSSGGEDSDEHEPGEDESSSRQSGGDESGSPDMSSSGSETDDEGDEDDRPSARTRQADRQHSKAAARHSRANGSSPQNGRRVSRHEQGKMPPRVTRSQDVPKLRSQRSNAAGVGGSKAPSRLQVASAQAGHKRK